MNIKNLTGLFVAAAFVMGFSDNAQANGAGCYIQKDDGIVMSIHRKTNSLQLPGGKARRGERTPEQTAIRGTKEETGLDVTIGRFLGAKPDFRLYECHPTKDFDAASLAPKTREVVDSLILNPFTMRDSSGSKINLRFRFGPADQKMLKSLMNQKKQMEQQQKFRP